MSVLKRLYVRLSVTVAAVGVAVVGALALTAQPALAHPDPSSCNLRYEDHGSWFTCTIGPYRGYQTALSVARSWDNTGHITNYYIEQYPSTEPDMWSVMLWVNRH